MAVAIVRQKVVLLLLHLDGDVQPASSESGRRGEEVWEVVESHSPHRRVISSCSAGLTFSLASAACTRNCVRDSME